MKLRKLLSLILMSVVIVNSMPTPAQASELEFQQIENQMNLSSEFVDLSTDFVLEELISPNDLPEIEANIMERQYVGGEITVDTGIEASAESPQMGQMGIAPASISSNTDPNNAYLVTNDTETYGMIETNGEFRWYAFVLNQNSKATIDLAMVSALDADLYIFELNQQNSTLGLIGGSTRAGGGVPENYSNTLNSGIYYIAVAGYSGTGLFAFSYYESSIDVGYEMNDTQATATTIPLNASIVGVIDHPNDIDYYKFTLTKRTAIKRSFTTTNGYTFGLIHTTGAQTNVANTTDIQILEPGTYTYVVFSSNGSYSSNSTYTINFKVIADGLVSTSSAPFLAINEPAGIVFQTNSSGSVFYVNGYPIDYSYSYEYSNSNASGSQNFNIKINTRSDVRVVLQGIYGPSVVNYQSSNRAYRYVPSKPLLALTFTSDPVLSPFYLIQCVATGAYANNHLWADFKSVLVLIDPATGLLVDIEQYNYWYDFIGGSNKLNYSTNFSTIYNYNK